MLMMSDDAVSDPPTTSGTPEIFRFKWKKIRHTLISKIRKKIHVEVQYFKSKTVYVYPLYSDHTLKVV